MKHCNTCSTTKERDQFHVRKKSVDGLSAKCKSCAKAYDESRLRHPHRVAARKAYSLTPEGIEKGNASKDRW